MLKKISVFLGMFLLCQGIALAEVIRINDTKYTATRPVYQSSGESQSSNIEEVIIDSDETSGDDGEIDGSNGNDSSMPDRGYNGSSGIMPKSSSNSAPPKSGGNGDMPENDGDGDGDGDGDPDSYDDCYFNCNDINADSCVYNDLGTISVDNNIYCKCPDTGEYVLQCDSQFKSRHDKSYNDYARAYGLNADASLSYDPYLGYHHQYIYYYDNLNVSDFCPVRLSDNLSVTISALSNTYYNRSRNLGCKTPAFGVNLVGGTLGLSSCLPPQARNNNQDVSICVYMPYSADVGEYIKEIDYMHSGDVSGFENCASKINKLSSVYARTPYTLNDSSNLPNNHQMYYYQYAPDNAYENIDDYYLSECFIDCGTSYNPENGVTGYDINPYCQGWYYLEDCEAFIANESNQFYFSNLSNVYMDASANHAFSGKTEICYDKNNGLKGSIVRCGIRHSYDAVNGVYSDADCATGNGTCQGVAGAYTCDSETYCSTCTCQSGYKTLAEWCNLNGVTVNCDTGHYEGVGVGCNYDDTSADMSNQKYQSWRLKSDNICLPEGQYVALANTGSTVAQLQTGYGTGIGLEMCYSGNTIMWQVSCQASYDNICYPPSNLGDWCIHGHDEATTMRSEAQSANPNRYCQSSGSVQGVCGVYALDNDGNTINTSSTVPMYVVSSPEQCHSTYGPGANVQPCGSTAGSNDTDGYNCYYDLQAFVYSTTTANGARLCEVRHDLRGNYVVYNGQKRWSECNCVDLYQYSIYNCTGNTVFSGKACKQDLSNVNYSDALIDKWRRAGLPYDNVHNQITVTSVDLYPYCKCKSNFPYTCDTNPERVSPAPGSAYCTIGNKTYYEACTCRADDLPPHWAADYFSCENGSKPTGVWKDNGCGEKMYQCSSAVACTSEYTETCSGVGEIGVGEGCQDNEGNYVRWKSCTCDTEWSTLCNLDNQSGIGEACTADGENKYKDCGCPSDYQNCVSPAVIPSGASSCTIETNIAGSSQKITDVVYSACTCPSSWTECSSDGQIGDDTDPTKVCVSGGTKYYENCTCPNTFEDCSVATPDRPLVPGIGIYTYTGVTTDGYGVCKLPNIAWDEYRYQACKCNEERFSQCRGIGATPIGASCQTVFDQYPLYTGCVCGGEYTDQCLESEGKIVNPAVDYDYCQINNGEKYYKPDDCLCEANGWQVCDPSVGQYGIGNHCLVGISSATNPEKYAACGCHVDYWQECSGAGLDATLSHACTTSSGVTKYSSCECQDGYDKTCSSPSLVPSNPNNYCEINGTKFYSSCSCNSEYMYECSPDEHLSPVNANDYCEEGGVRKYKQCKCQQGYNATCTEEGQVPPTSGTDVAVSGWSYNSGACVLNGVSYYTTCKCASGMRNCSGSFGAGSGVTCIDNGTRDDNGNWYGGTPYYSQCICGSQYVDCGVGSVSGATCINYSGELHRVDSLWVMQNITQTTFGTMCTCPTQHNYQYSPPMEEYYVADVSDCSDHAHGNTYQYQCVLDDAATCTIRELVGGTYSTTTTYKCSCSQFHHDITPEDPELP